MHQLPWRDGHRGAGAGVIAEDEVLDKESLPKVKMPIGDDYARLPDWKHGTPRLQGYHY